MNQTLKDRVVVITGGAAGMGRHHALHFASQGAHIAVGDLSSAEDTVAAVKAAGGQAWAGSLDVSSEDGTAKFAADVLEAYGRIDVLINNAGIYPFKSFDSMTFAEWRKVMAVNLDGSFLMAKAVVPAMRSAGWGRIINVASAEAWMAAPNNLHYIASKMGVVGLTRALATETAVDGITVNAIAPGIVADTSINKLMPDYLQSIPQNFQAIKRAAQPSDIAAAALFLASPQAAFITGQTLVVDGGGVRL